MIVADLRAEKTFNVVETLSVNILIRNDYIGKYITGTHPT